MTKNIKNDDRGLTLIELILGVVILAIVITPLLHTLITGANTTMKAKRYTDATIAAQNIAEEIAACDMSAYLAGFTQTGGVYAKTLAAESGGTEFDARVTVTPASSNIPVSNSMDAQLALQAADETAYAQLQSEISLEGGSCSMLSRAITITVSPVGSESGTCRIEAAFEYTGSISYLDADGNARSKGFGTVVRQSRNVSTPADASFSAFLFFMDNPGNTEAVPLSVNTGVIRVYNTSAVDFNLYLIDVSETSTVLTREVNYYPSSETTMSLMTNMGQNSVKYRAFVSGSNSWMRAEDIPVGLAKTSVVERSFEITIDIFQYGQAEAEDASPVFSLEIEKLDYSMQ